MKIDISKLDLEDPEIQEALRVMEYEQVFNTEFKNFCKSAYWCSSWR